MARRAEAAAGTDRARWRAKRWSGSGLSALSISIGISLGLTLVTGALASAQEAASATALHWDYLPQVGYLGDDLWFSLRIDAPSAAQWTVSADGAHVDSHLGADGLTVDGGIPLTSAGPRTVLFQGPEGQRRVQLVTPGHGHGLSSDGAGHLLVDGDPAVLVVERTEASHDRRWHSLRSSGPAPDVRCSVRLSSPVVTVGDSGLLAEIVASQAVTVNGADVLVEIPAIDRFAGWKHREFRQALAWLVSDLRQRGARRLVLLDPLAAGAEWSLVEPLTLEVADIASAYHCSELALPQLAQESYWQLAPGVLGPVLNADGQATLERLLAPYR